MSLIDDRTALAAAMDGVTDVNGHDRRPAAPRLGDAWPFLERFDVEQGLVLRPTWKVIVLLPQDEFKASEWMDDHLALIFAALRGPGWAESAEPALMRVGRTDAYVLEISLKMDP